MDKMDKPGGIEDLGALLLDAVQEGLQLGLLGDDVIKALLQVALGGL